MTTIMIMIMDNYNDHNANDANGYTNVSDGDRNCDDNSGQGATRVRFTIVQVTIVQVAVSAGTGSKASSAQP